MELWFSILPELLAGTVILAAGFRFIGESGSGARLAVFEGPVWASAFFVLFSIETLLIANS